MFLLRSKTVKYALRKMSPRTQVSEGLMYSVPPLKVIKQMSLETWGRQKYTPVSVSTFLPPPQYPEQTVFPFFPPFWEESSGSHSSGRSEGIGTRRAKTCGCHDRGVWGGEDWEFGIIRCELIYRDCKTTKSYCIAQVTVFGIP